MCTYTSSKVLYSRRRRFLCCFVVLRKKIVEFLAHNFKWFYSLLTENTCLDENFHWFFFASFSSVNTAISSSYFLLSFPPCPWNFPSTTWWGSVEPCRNLSHPKFLGSCCEIRRSLFLLKPQHSFAQFARSNPGYMHPTSDEILSIRLCSKIVRIFLSRHSIVFLMIQFSYKEIENWKNIMALLNEWISSKIPFFSCLSSELLLFKV